MFCFFKQKTAYEMRIGDWSSDVCSSDLPDSLAIDTFYSSTVSTQLNLVWTEDQPLDASRFRPYYLPGDAPAWDGNGNAMENLWSGVLAGSAGDKAWYRTNDGFGTPHHFQFDLGVTTQLTDLRIWQRGAIRENNLLYANAKDRKSAV